MANKCVQPFFHMKKMADLVPVTYVYNTSNIGLSSFRRNGFFSFTQLKKKKTNFAKRLKVHKLHHTEVTPTGEHSSE